MPVPVPTVATPVALLVHVPPGAALASVNVCVAHSDPAPVITSIGVTVTVVCAAQPDGKE